MTNYLFIGGAGHSGTTMLDHIFSSHSSSIGAKGESRIADSLELFEKDYFNVKDPEKRLEFISNAIYFGYNFKKKEYTTEAKEKSPFYISSFPKNQLVGDFCKDVKSVIDYNLQEKEKSLFVEKTPSNVHHIKNVLKIVPNAKILIIHRDVRDVVASLKKRFLTLKKNPREFSHNLETKKLDKDYNLIIDSYLWAKAVKATNSKNENIKVIKYEEFVNNPEIFLREICAWLEIEFESQMLNLKSRNSSDLALKNSQGVSNKSVGGYKKVFSSKELHLIQKYSSDQMTNLGLELENISISSKAGSFFLEVKEYSKIGIRVFKRVALMDKKYVVQFGKNLIKKIRA